MKLRVAALALLLGCGAAALPAAQPKVKHPPAKHAAPAPKAPKQQKPYVNMRNSTKAKQHHVVPKYKGAKRPAVTHAKPPKAPKHKA